MRDGVLARADPELNESIEKEEQRQKSVLNMIPSENAASPGVRAAMASVLSNKYSEGYPDKRYYQGNEFIDEVEKLAIERAKKLYGAEHANVQSLSGSPANFSVYLAFMEPGDTFLGMDLSCGGHLTHGSPVNFSGKIYTAEHYGVDKETGLIDMEEVRRIAKKVKPKIIVSGHSAYPRKIDFKAFQEIAEEVGAIHVADVSHLSGLIAGGVHPNPFPDTDIVTMTTHKSLRGPRGAIIMCKEKYGKAIDKAVFPGSQGGAHNNMIAAKAVAFKEAMTSEFKEYCEQIVLNAKALAGRLMERGIKLVTDGTDNHLILIDLIPTHGESMGKPAAIALEKAGIVANYNGIPYDPAPPFKPSGVRMGTPWLTTWGLTEDDMLLVADCIADVLEDIEDEDKIAEVKERVTELTKKFHVR